MPHAGLRLDVDAERAEEQELEQGGLADTLKEIVGRTMPSPRYVRFHEAHVQRYLSRLKAFPPRCGSSLTLILCPMPLPVRSMGSNMIPCHCSPGCHRYAHSSWCFSLTVLLLQRSAETLSLTVSSTVTARWA